MRRAVIVSIGDELACGESLDTHAQWLSQRLWESAFTVVEHLTLPDDESHIVDALRRWIGACELIVITGGLGPTQDDLTREALASAVGGALCADHTAERALRERFESRGLPMPESNLKQSLRPSWMECVANPFGTAPGLMGERCGTLVAALPGPPNEMHPMWSDRVAPAIAKRWGPGEAATEVVRACGLSESVAAERLGRLMERGRNPQVGITLDGAVLCARVRALGAAARDGSVEAICAEIERHWAGWVFGRGSTTLAESCGTALKDQHASVSTCESCTGGGVAHALTEVPGSSAWFHSGWVTYANEAKVALGVDRAIIVAHGAVSSEVARSMAAAAAHSAHARFAIATTGIAGPSGGTTDKPVGTVWIHVHDAQRDSVPRCFHISGDRALVRERAVTLALVMLRSAVRGESLPRLIWEAP